MPPKFKLQLRRKTPAKRFVIKPITRKRGKKSVYNVSIKRGLGMGNVAYATLSLNVPTFSVTVPLTGTGSVSNSIFGNSIAPFANTATPVIGSQDIPTQNWLYQGLQQYSPYFNRYYVLSQKVTVRATMLTTALGTQQPIQLIGSAYEYSGAGASDNLDPTVLDQTVASQILNQKGVRSLTILPIGNQASKSMTMKRSTKKILGATDLNDNRNFSGTLDREFITYPGNFLEGVNSPQRAWFYYFRLQNPENQPNIPTVTLSYKITANIMFTDRVQWELPITKLPTPPPSA